jgi:hypothetical protein
MSLVVLDESRNPSLNAEEVILHAEEEVRLFRTADEGAGRFLISNQRILFIQNAAVEAGLFWNFRDIALHAISR